MRLVLCTGRLIHEVTFAIGFRHFAVFSTVPSAGRGRHAVRNLARTDGTPPQPSVPSEHKNDGRTADVCRGRYFDRPRPSSTVPGRHRAVTVYT